VKRTEQPAEQSHASRATSGKAGLYSLPSVRKT
jgi:hypothetical protein